MNKDSEFSYFNPPINKVNTKPASSWTIARVTQEIKGENLIRATKEIRSCTTEKVRKILKKKLLPYVTFAGTFEFRKNEALINRSGLIVIDCDHLDQERIQEAKKLILQTFQPALIFTSPSGNGLKVICCIDLALDHTAYFDAFRLYFQQFSLEIDKGCDIVRACFLCHDPEAMAFPDPTMFGQDFIDRHSSENAKETLRRGEMWLNDKKELLFVNGSRHNYITALSGFLNRAGINQSTATKLLLSFEQPDFEKSEIVSIVDCIYKDKNLHGSAPMKITPSWRESYSSFPLRLLWGPQESFYDRIEVILSDAYPHSSNEIPTSIKTDYLKDTLDRKLPAELLILLAAVKSIIGMRNFCSTSKEVIFKRMFGNEQWRRYTKYYMNKLLSGAVDRKMMSIILRRRGMYISICLSVEDLEQRIMEQISIKADNLRKRQEAAARISEYKKQLGKQ